MYNSFYLSLAGSLCTNNRVFEYSRPNMTSEEIHHELTPLLTPLAPISLQEMSSIRLMNRTDTKFLTNLPTLQNLLRMVHDDYWIQEIEGGRNMAYNTTYFDTPDFSMFRIHQSGHSGRQKLRFRTYVASHLQFMEVKTKNNHGRTRKKRISVSDMNLEDREKIDFLSRTLRYKAEDLSPSLQNSFDRITLVNKGKTERLTIDTNLQFFNPRTGNKISMGPLVIIELKRDGLYHSPVLDMLRELRIKPHGFSKYCMGSAFTNQSLQINRFKPRIRDVKRIIYNTPPN